MKDDPLRLDLLEDLRLIRLGTGEFSIERLTFAESLTDFLGRGSVEQAFTSLLDYLAQQGGDLEGDVRAYFETCGVGISLDNLDLRLKEYATGHRVDQRTALRRSDRGAARLSYIIRDSYLYERPMGNLVAFQHGALINVNVSIEVIEQSQYRRPQVYINDVLQDGLEFTLHESETHPMLLEGKQSFWDIPLNIDASEDDPLATVHIAWVMPVWPTWSLGATFLDSRLYAKLSVSRNNFVEMDIHWANEESASSRDRPLLDRGDAREAS